MLRGSRAVVCASLVVAALFLLSAAPAAAFCAHPTIVYNTGLLTGTGSNCTQADLALNALLQDTARANCQNLAGGDNGDIDWPYYSATINSCTTNGTGKQETGSASYRCVTCVSP